jgi:hypothetical protein
LIVIRPYSPKAVILIEQEKKSFRLPRLFYATTQLCNNAFNGHFKQGMEQELYLVVDTVEAFEMVVQ